ncbi:bifunctional oligoribonuclease/PAP phosphatase NrnA [Flavobacterium sp.]|jgi:phosphoesterase RecJ-like protein|uniref:bifunctional oligoribonuclease/PAP phosphatase NrnA n=1 Tax=Flavobacterium sp. TaxID=239 RepID=UPI0037C18DE4
MTHLNETQIKELQQLLANPKKIAIIPHRNVDGDAMGSTLGLYHILKLLNHQITVVVPNEIPDYLQWIPGIEEATLIYEGTKNLEAIEVLNEAELIFTLDFNAFHRAGEQMETVLKTLSATFIMIDHHEKPDNFAKYTFSDIGYSSTCQMVYELIQKLALGDYINLTAATCLYTGIATDSGGFRFPRTTGNLHRIVGNLIDIGVNNSQIHENLYDNGDYNKLQILGKALSNMKVLPEYKTSYIALSQQEQNELQVKKGDTEGIVNYGLTIKNIDFTAFFTEVAEEKIIKISFRSQGDFDVNQFARNHFNGGGHKNAAGGKSFDTLEGTITKFIAILAVEKK